jgi:hypothetical protein
MSGKNHNEVDSEGPWFSGAALDGRTAAPVSGREIELPDEAMEASTVLVVESGGTQAEGVCRAFYPEGRLDEASLLIMSLAGGAGDRINAVRSSDLPFPRNLTVISTEDRFGTVRTETGADGTGRDVAVRTVKDPSDLPKLGMSITSVVEEWSEEEILICFDSLSRLVRTVDPERVYRFVRVLEDRLGGLDARIHFHVSGEACDDRTLSTLQSLFDTVVDVPTDLESS